MIKRIFSLLKYPFVGPTRLGRVDYINLCALLSIFTIILSISAIFPAVTFLLDPGNKFISLLCLNLILLVLFIFIFFIRLNNARLHDLNCSGWWNILAIIPLINLIFYLVLFIKSGTKSENKFGKQSISPSSIKKIAVIFSLMVIWGVNATLIFLSVASQMKQ